MKKIFFIFYILIKVTFTQYKIFKLSYSNPFYYISMKLDSITNITQFILSNNIPISFIPTSKCQICTKFKLDLTETNLVSIKKDIIIPYYHYNYIGNIYHNEIYIGNITSELDFIGFNDITYKSQFTDNGIFALSYLNYNFNTTKKIFAFKFIDSDCEIHIGDYDLNFISNISHLKIFNVTLDNNNSTDKILKPIWYINFTSILINNNSIKYNSDNDNNQNINIKLSLDIGTDKLHIPKKFFFDNLNLIFPKNSQCQLNPNGYFLCRCNKNYKENFGHFIFKNYNNNEIFNISPTDYIVYESSISESTCRVNIKVNYENDIFIGGIGVLKNYYSIFDVDNKTFMIYKKEKEPIFLDMEHFILFLIFLSFVLIIIFGIYCCRKLFQANNRINEEAQEALNQNQEESSEETD